MSDLATSTGHELGEVWDLENLAVATGLCAWMFSQFADFVSGNVIEIGAGIGTFSERILGCGVTSLLLVEPEPACMDVLRRRFDGDGRVDLAQEQLPGSRAVAARSGSMDFVLCQNVLEHISDDASTVRAMAVSLKPGGRLGVLVPAHPRLYGRLDRSYGHVRRYTRDSLLSLLGCAGLRVEDIYSFNMLGVPGWWVKNRIGSTGVDSGSLRAYELLLRAWRPIEERMRPGFGLSFVAVAQKPE